MNGKEANIVLRCSGEIQLMVMYQDTGITLVRGRRDGEGMIVLLGDKMELSFATHPGLVGLYFDHAWDAEQLNELARTFCWEGSRA